MTSTRCCHCRPCESPSASPAGMDWIKPDAVGGVSILARWSDVHPADDVAAALDHQVIGEVAEPGRQIDAQGRPLVGGALAVAMHIEHAAVERDHAVVEGGLAEAGAGGDGIDGMAADRERGDYVVEIAVTPTPEVEVVDGRGGGEACGSRREPRLRPGRRRLPTVRWVCASTMRTV